jgi:Rad3-related DNA helicase
MTKRKVRQVVTLPYNLLLHRDARDALGIDLTNQIVVVDEAHSKHFAKRGAQTLTKFLLDSTRSHIVVALVINCHAPAAYPGTLLGTTYSVHLTIQE